MEENVKQRVHDILCTSVDSSDLIDRLYYQLDIPRVVTLNSGFFNMEMLLSIKGQIILEKTITASNLHKVYKKYLDFTEDNLITLVEFYYNSYVKWLNLSTITGGVQQQLKSDGKELAIRISIENDNAAKLVVSDFILTHNVYYQYTFPFEEWKLIWHNLCTFFKSL